MRRKRRATGRLTARFSVLAAVGGALALACFWAAPQARAEDHGRVTIIEENDGLLPDHRDRHYTQGGELTYLSPMLGSAAFAQQFYSVLSGPLPIFQPGPSVQRRFDVVLGQSIFTPTRYHDAPPDPRDRPFAGWLFSGGSLLQETGGRTLENFELLAGVVGPSSLGKDAQEAFHAAAGFNNRNLDATWKYQLKDEPGIMLTYERKVRMFQTSFYGVEAEVIPEAGVTVGNVMTYGQIGGQFRIGHNLQADYGVPRIRPALSGTSWFDGSRMTSPFGWYLYGGVQGRAVARNIFLDGNSFANSRSVDKEIVVADFTAGASIFYKDWAKLDFTYIERSPEFTTQKQWDHFAGANLSIGF